MGADPGDRLSNVFTSKRPARFSTLPLFHLKASGEITWTKTVDFLRKAWCTAPLWSSTSSASLVVAKLHWYSASSVC